MRERQHYQDCIADIGLTIKRLERSAQLNHERYLETVKTLYEVRNILEKTEEYYNKTKVAISEIERIERALKVIKPKTPSGTHWTID